MKPKSRPTRKPPATDVAPAGLPAGGGFSNDWKVFFQSLENRPGPMVRIPGGSGKGIDGTGASCYCPLSCQTGAPVVELADT